MITFVLVPVLIPTLKGMKFGQSIREEGPQPMKKTIHQRCGGLTFHWYCDNVFGGYYRIKLNPIILLLFVTIGFKPIGFIDDYIIVKKNNQGLTSKQKFWRKLVLRLFSLF